MPSARPSSLQIPHLEFPGGTSFATAGEHGEVASLIRRLVLSAAAGAADPPLHATLKPLTGGRSAASVFKLTPYFGAGRRLKGPPVVVKIASRAKGAGEKANYEQFVRSGLPSASRPELLGFAQTRAYAGLCYSFVGDPGRSRPDTLTARLRRADVAKLGLVLRKFFDPLRDTWHSAALVRAEGDIARRYMERYFAGPGATGRTEAALRDCAARYFNARQANGRYVIGGLSFPSPRAILFAAGHERAYKSCILHGDLNSDNIVFIRNAPGMAVIDFQKTGRGHVYEDLMHVEASVRINYPRDAAFGEILDKERLIAMGRRRFRDDPYCTSIRNIRDTALRHFGRRDSEANYHFAAAAIGLRLMQATDLTHVARARITASALWAAKALAGEL